MRLADAIRDGGGARDGSTWYSVGELSVESGQLGIADLGQVAAVRVPVPNGLYHFEAQLIEPDNCPRVSRLRGIAAGMTGERSVQCGRISVELAHVSVADVDAIQRKLNRGEFEEMLQLAANFGHVDGDICQLNFESGTVQFIVCSSGSADGCYPVYTLVSGQRVVGLEIVFVGDENRPRS